MSNNKQSSIEWLREELLKRDMDISVKDLFEQAKAMEKEEIIQFATDYVSSECYASFNGNVECACSVEEFYEQTYGGNK